MDCVFLILLILNKLRNILNGFSKFIIADKWLSANVNIPLIIVLEIVFFMVMVRSQQFQVMSFIPVFFRYWFGFGADCYRGFSCMKFIFRVVFCFFLYYNPKSIFVRTVTLILPGPRHDSTWQPTTLPQTSDLFRFVDDLNSQCCFRWRPTSCFAHRSLHVIRRRIKWF